MINIEFDCWRYSADDGLCTLFTFYPNGKWDENKAGLEEALKNYPPSKYNWILVKQEQENVKN